MVFIAERNRLTNCSEIPFRVLLLESEIVCILLIFLRVCCSMEVKNVDNLFNNEYTEKRF